MSQPDVSTEVETVLAWHQAVNDGDVSRFVGVVAPDVELEGIAVEDSAGLDGLSRWVEETKVQLAPRRVFRRDSVVVVEQSALWWAEDARQLSQPAQAAMLFELTDGSITRIVRYPDGARALEAAGLDESDLEVERVR
jgi:ketosteroid isomerase-like protein